VLQRPKSGPPHIIATFGTALQPTAITPSFISMTLKAVFTFWQQHGVDQEVGGFFDGVEIAAPHDPSPPTSKAQFANGRQIYAYCLAALEFPDMRTILLEAAGGGVRFMREHFWQDAAGNKGRVGKCADHGGWVVATDRCGSWVQPYGVCVSACARGVLLGFTLLGLKPGHA
jgi:mannose/cellobiose epimerase-like protein (N-acyl-D-glucosamine 2-epimerase family)